MLRRLGRSNLALTLDGGAPATAVTGSRLAALVTGHISRGFDGDRRAASADPWRGSRAGARRERGGAAGRRRSGGAFERLATVIGLIADLARWPAHERERLRRPDAGQGRRGARRRTSRCSTAIGACGQSLQMLAREAPAP